MKQLSTWKKLSLLFLASGLLLTVAFAQTHSGTQRLPSTDTVPAKQKKVQDLDEALADIERGEVEMERALKEFDGEKIAAEVREAMKGVNIDMAMMKKEVSRAMKEIDMQQINRDVQQALKEIDSDKLWAQVEASLAAVDMDAVKVEMDKLSKIDFKKIQVEMEAIQPEIEKAMQEARRGLDAAKTEIKSYQKLVTALETDGHLKKGDGYKIEYSNGELTVNGKKLSADETGKYKEFIGDKKDLTIRENKDGTSVNN